LSGLTDKAGVAAHAMQASGMTQEQSLGSLNWLLQQQSSMVATNQIFLWVAVIFTVGAFAIWLAPRPVRSIGGGGTH